ncbi:MAG: dimethylargininase [Gemmatimonadota bacterium]
MIALTRAVSPSIAHCELTHIARDPIRYEIARDQHSHYEACLRELGCAITQLPPGDEFPDCVFIEDTAIVLDELAIITRPGAASRRGETAAVSNELSKYRSIRSIEAPATLDGGDALQVGRTIYVGVSTRTNSSGVAQLDAIARSCGYTVAPVEVTDCLHLKSAVTEVAPGTILLNPGLVSRDAFAGLDVIETHPDEPAGANAVRLGGTVLYSNSFPLTLERLRQRGFKLMTTDTSELARAEGALTCCSLLFQR